MGQIAEALPRIDKRAHSIRFSSIGPDEEGELVVSGGGEGGGGTGLCVGMAGVEEALEVMLQASLTLSPLHPSFSALVFSGT